MNNYSQKYQFPFLKINTDSSPELQPEKTYRFALNAVVDNNGILHNEQLLQYMNQWSFGQKIIGSVYVGDDEVVIFTANQQYSQIVKLKGDGTYDILIPSCTELGLKENTRVRAVYREVNGGEKVIYFTDGYNKPRHLNIDRLEYYFEDDNGINRLVPERLNIIPDYSIPKIDLQVLDNNGTLKSGSYNVAIQYLSKDFSTTNWVSISDIVNVYRDSIKKGYQSINGSYSGNGLGESLKKLLYTENTSKAIKVNLDHKGNENNYEYYRIALICATNGTGEINRVYVSPRIPIDKTEYIITGNFEGYQEISVNEIFPDKPDIAKVKYIEQIDRRLILANGSGKSKKWCELQQFASRIVVNYRDDIGVEENVEDRWNSKTIYMPRRSFMPGEVYPLGIVYIFKDGTKSPVYHIPGRPADVSSGFSSNMDFYETESGIYRDKDCNCVDGYWGIDAWGNPLVGKKVRHHKIPDLNQLVDIIGNNKISGTSSILVSATVNPSDYDTDGYFEVGRIEFFDSQGTSLAVLTNIGSTEIQDPPNVSVTVPVPVDNYAYYEISNVTYQYTTYDAGGNPQTVVLNISNYTSELTSNAYYAKSIKVVYLELSNIIRPSNDVIGYYIVTPDRDDSNRMVLDTGYGYAMRYDVNNPEQLLFYHELNGTNSNATFNPEYLWVKSPRILNEKSHLNPKAIRIEGVIQSLGSDRTEFHINQNDAYPGSSSKGLFFGLVTLDPDGMDWILYGRYNKYSEYLTRGDASSYYNSTFGQYTVIDNAYLPQSYTYHNFGTSGKSIVNLQLDNQVAVYQLGSNVPTLNDETNPVTMTDLFIVTLLSGNNDIFPVLESIVYNHTDAEVKYFNGPIETCQVMRGDIVVSSMQDNYSTYYYTYQKTRLIETISNAIAIYFTAGLAAAITIATMGAGIPVIFAVITEILSGVIGISAEVLSLVLKQTIQGTYKNFLHFDFVNPIEDYIGRDDAILSIAEAKDGIPVYSTLNADLRLVGDTQNTMFRTTKNGDNLAEYFKNKYLFKDETREDSESLTLKLIPIPEFLPISKDYNRRPLQKAFFPIPYEYDCKSDYIEQFPNRIMWSERSLSGEEKGDAYRSFLPNNYRDVSSEYGEITGLATLGEKLYVFTERMIYVFPPNYQEKITTDFTTYIGTGEFLAIGPQIIVDDKVGNIGTLYQDSIAKTSNSILFVDTYSKNIYLISSQGLKNLSAEGMMHEFRRRLSIEEGKDTSRRELLHLDDGYGVISEYDPVNNRYIVSVKDYEYNNGNLINKSFSISFSLYSMGWVSYHEYLPTLMQRTSNSLYIVEDGEEIYKLSDINQYNGRMILEAVIPNNLIFKLFGDNIQIKVKTLEYNGDGVNELKYNFFDRILFFNDRQVSGWKDIIVKQDEMNYMLNSVTDSNTTVLADYHDSIFSINSIRDYRSDYTVPVFITNPVYLQGEWFIDKILNNSSIDLNKLWYELEPFKGNYLGIRLEYNSQNTHKLEVYGLQEITNPSIY